MIMDQAARLREMVKQMDRQARPPVEMLVKSATRPGRPRPAAERPRSRVIALTSGKGGVGKTSLAVNLGIFWAQMGKRVILLDLDLGLANVDVILNLRPRYNLSHVVMGKVRISEALTFCGGLGIVPGSSGIPAVANLDADGRGRLIEDFAQLETMADIIILDTAAGVGANVIEFLSAADDIMVVATPEPTSVVDAYAMVKMLSRQPGCGQINLVVNMARDRREGLRVSRGIVEVSRRFLNKQVRALGYVPTDQHVVESVRQRQPFVLTHPNAQVTKAVRGIGRAMLGRTPENTHSTGNFLGRMLTFLSDPDESGRTSKGQAAAVTER